MGNDLTTLGRLFQAAEPFLLDGGDLLGSLRLQPGLIEFELDVEPFLRPDAKIDLPENLTCPDHRPHGRPGVFGVRAQSAGEGRLQDAGRPRIGHQPTVHGHRFRPVNRLDKCLLNAVFFDQFGSEGDDAASRPAWCLYRITCTFRFPLSLRHGVNEIHSGEQSEEGNQCHWPL